LVEVTIKNQGPVATDSGFWVDFYVNPSSTPTAANELWQDLATKGIAWGVTVSLAPGEELTLIYSTQSGAPNLYYSPQDSNFVGTLPAGTPVYAQVDSAHVNHADGAIIETHEISGEAYNNISDQILATNVSSSSESLSSQLSMTSVVANHGLPPR
jgi:hypothetical protein